MLVMSLPLDRFVEGLKAIATDVLLVVTLPRHNCPANATGVRSKFAR